MAFRGRGVGRHRVGDSRVLQRLLPDNRKVLPVRGPTEGDVPSRASADTCWVGGIQQDLVDFFLAYPVSRDDDVPKVPIFVVLQIPKDLVDPHGSFPLGPIPPAFS